MKIDLNPALCYDDVLIAPNYSEITPGQVIVKTKFSKNITLDIPLISAAMDTVTDGKMALSMAKAGGIGVIHKNYTPENQALEVKFLKDHGSYQVAGACGIGAHETQRAQILVENGVDALVIDTAHGHSKGVIDQVKNFKKLFKNIDVVAGNIATLDAARALVEAGVDGVKIGIGPGSICTTRVIAGIGVPQLQALLNVSEYLRKQDIPFIADGGIRYSGDIVKALATGASSVMLGSLLAATNESASELIVKDGVTYKRYRGMGSLTAMGLGSKDRYSQGDIENKRKLVPEGVEGIIPSKGATNDFLYQLVGGLRSGMGYIGAKNLNELYEKACFQKISTTSLKENHPHSIVQDIKAPNY